MSDQSHILTIMLEDYFHVEAFQGLIHPDQWYRFDTRFEQNTLRALDLLDRFNIKATFFVLGWVADKQPEIIAEVARRGHELASRGYFHRDMRNISPADFREDLIRSREALEQASGQSIVGYRAPHRWSSPEDLWALDILMEEGFLYDSSLVPLGRAFRREPWRRFTHEHQSNGRSIWEIPVSTANLLGWSIPIAGGNYMRQLPNSLLKRAVEYWHNKYDKPFVMYTHVWELDPEQPRIEGASPLAKIRHYRNLDKMYGLLEEYFEKYSFTGISRYLNLEPPVDLIEEKIPAAAPIQVIPEPSLLPSTNGHGSHKALEEAVEYPRPEPPPRVRTPITVVIPCYNEEYTLPYLANTLRSLESNLEDLYKLNFIFVDDRSTDSTYNTLVSLFGKWENVSILQNIRNLGVAATILNGIRHAETEIVCSMDCDCTYDPHELKRMIPLLSDEVDLVTASPYHPEGGVRNVPEWRLTLSRAASFLYRQVLRQKLHTYTSCFRVYRKSAVSHLFLTENGFLGVAELLARLDVKGSKIVEHPATLEVRLFGQSKMRIMRTVFGHFQLLARVVGWRLQAQNHGKVVANKNLLIPTQPGPKAN